MLGPPLGFWASREVFFIAIETELQKNKEIHNKKLFFPIKFLT